MVYAHIILEGKSVGVRSFLPVLFSTHAHFSVGAHSFLPIIGRNQKVSGYTLSCQYYIIHIHTI